MHEAGVEFGYLVILGIIMFQYIPVSQISAHLLSNKITMVIGCHRVCGQNWGQSTVGVVLASLSFFVGFEMERGSNCHLQTNFLRQPCVNQAFIVIQSASLACCDPLRNVCDVGYGTGILIHILKVRSQCPLIAGIITSSTPHRHLTFVP